MACLQDAIQIDGEAELGRVAHFLREALRNPLRRKGFVVAVSGGIDSAVCATLAARTVGTSRLRLLFMPERESEAASLALAESLARSLGTTLLVEDIAPTLEALGCYARRNAAIRRVVPEFADHWGCKLVLPPAASNALALPHLIVQAPRAAPVRVRLGPGEYRDIVAASNFKQRVRAMLAYHLADSLHYAVVGTPNRLEYALGFFVKGGDGLADVKPIAHLYKTQVYALAEFLGVPDEIRRRPPTTDTFSLPQTQEEFYYTLPYATLDLLLLAHDDGWSARATARSLALDESAVAAAFGDIDRKRAVAESLHATGLTCERIPGGGGNGSDYRSPVLRLMEAGA